jgi:hypothetical protein
MLFSVYKLFSVRMPTNKQANAKREKIAVKKNKTG